LDKTLRAKHKQGALYTCETALIVRDSTGPVKR